MPSDIASFIRSYLPATDENTPPTSFCFSPTGTSRKPKWVVPPLPGVSPVGSLMGGLSQGRQPPAPRRGPAAVLGERRRPGPPIAEGQQRQLAGAALRIGIGHELARAQVLPQRLLGLLRGQVHPHPVVADGLDAQHRRRVDAAAARLGADEVVTAGK